MASGDRTCERGLRCDQCGKRKPDAHKRCLCGRVSCDACEAERERIGVNCCEDYQDPGDWGDQ